VIWRNEVGAGEFVCLFGRKS